MVTLRDIVSRLGKVFQVDVWNEVFPFDTDRCGT